MSIRQFLKNESGQSAVYGALCLTVVVAFVGLAVDVGSLRYSEHKLQVAAESAALAAALEVTSCQGLTNCAAMQAAAHSALDENGLTGSTTFLSCNTMTGSGLRLLVDNPPCFKGPSDPNSGKSTYVETVVAETEQTYFAKVVGFNNVPLIARAEAMRSGNPNCIYALDPTGGNAITVDVLANLSANCGVVDESSAANAFSCNVLAGVHVTNLKITGGVQNFLCNSSPSPHTGVPVPSPADPLAYLPKPSLLGCGNGSASPYHGSSGPVIIAGVATLYPDQAYCGGITLLPSSNVTFMPGTYTIKSGGLGNLFGGLSIDLGATAIGNGVTFYNYGPIGGVNFVAASLTLGTITLTAPTTGTYAGVLFFQDPGNTSPAVILASSSFDTTLEGAYYFPSATVTCAATGLSRYNILVAKDIDFAALSFGIGTLNNTTFSNNYSSLPNGSPLAGGGSVLVQ